MADESIFPGIIGEIIRQSFQDKDIETVEELGKDPKEIVRPESDRLQ